MLERIVLLSNNKVSNWREIDTEKVRFSFLKGTEFVYLPRRKREMKGFLPPSWVSPDKFKAAKFKYLTFKKRHKQGGIIYSVRGKFVLIHYLYGHQRQKFFLLKKLSVSYPDSCLAVYIYHNISFAKKLLKKGGKLRKINKKSKAKMEKEENRTLLTRTYYAKKAQEFFENTVKIDMSDFYCRFEKYLPEGGYILDIGCGSGRDVKYFKDKGYQVLGLDVSEELIKLAREYSKAEILNLDVRNLNYQEKFDGIWASASLLHLFREEVGKVLKKCAEALKPEGVIYTSFKYGNFEGIRRGRFFSFFNEKIIKELLQTIPQLELLEIWKTTDLRPGRESEAWLNLIARKIK